MSLSLSSWDAQINNSGLFLSLRPERGQSSQLLNSNLHASTPATSSGDLMRSMKKKMLMMIMLISMMMVMMMMVMMMMVAMVMVIYEDEDEDGDGGGGGGDDGGV